MRQSGCSSDLNFGLVSDLSVFQALVASGREKDKLFHQVQGSVAPDATTVAPPVVKTAMLQELRDEVAHLKNQLLNKDG